MGKRRPRCTAQWGRSVRGYSARAECSFCNYTITPARWASSGSRQSDMPTSPRHFKDEVQDLLDNRLDAPMRAEVERHLESCVECRREFEALRWTKLFAAKQFAAKEAPPELRQNISRALKADGGSPKTITPLRGFQTPKLK